MRVFDFSQKRRWERKIANMLTKLPKGAQGKADIADIMELIEEAVSEERKKHDRERVADKQQYVEDVPGIDE